MKRAILQVADTGPLESLVAMLSAAGYACYLPSRGLKNRLKSIGCDTVLDIDTLVRQWGYPEPTPLSLTSGGHNGVSMDSCDLYVDVKAHRAYDKVIKEWPRLKGKVLWYRINGGKPEHVVRYEECDDCDGGGMDGRPLRNAGPCAGCNGTGKVISEDCGDEVNPPCPVLTPNQWYGVSACPDTYVDREGASLHGAECDHCFRTDKTYTCWPPFVRFDHYTPSRLSNEPADQVAPPRYTNPICLLHNAKGWGYGRLFDPFRELGVRIHGVGSPDGLLNHNVVRQRLRECLAFVHLKSSDAPGYAIYEAMASGCPVVCTRRLIWRCRMQDLLIPGETCLVFDRETHDPLTDADVASCVDEVESHLIYLRDPEHNREIGNAGRERLKSVMWDANRDGAGFKAWMGRVFP
jgi:hypothetical protein